MDLADAMAIAVLKGDRVAAYALADKLTEERLRGDTPLDVGYRDHRMSHVDGFAVYSWPEFVAFCRRLGILWDLRTVEVAIRLPVDGRVEITQQYLGGDRAQ